MFLTTLKSIAESNTFLNILIGVCPLGIFLLQSFAKKKLVDWRHPFKERIRWQVYAIILLFIISIWALNEKDTITDNDKLLANNLRDKDIKKAQNDKADILMAIKEKNLTYDPITKKLVDSLTKLYNSQSKLLARAKSSNQSADKAILQIENSLISAFEVGKPIKIRSTLENINNVATKILKSQYAISIDDTTYRLKSFDNVSKKIFNINTYTNLGHKIPQIESTDDGRNLDEDNYKAILENRSFIIYSGYIEYENLVTHQKKAYKFMQKLNSIGLVENLLNENIDIQ
ncbi:hypothetical protein ACFGVR_02470 [Mucilaginibacter sp. AW1-3]